MNWNAKKQTCTQGRAQAGSKATDNSVTSHSFKFDMGKNMVPPFNGKDVEKHFSHFVATTLGGQSITGHCCCSVFLLVNLMKCTLH